VISEDLYHWLCTAEKICDRIVVEFSVSWDCHIGLGVQEFLHGGGKRGTICLPHDWGSDLVIPELGTICGLFLDTNLICGIEFSHSKFDDGPFNHCWYLWACWIGMVLR